MAEDLWHAERFVPGPTPYFRAIWRVAYDLDVTSAGSLCSQTVARSQLTVTVRGPQGWRFRHSIGKPGQAGCSSCFMAIFKHRIGYVMSAVRRHVLR